MTNFQTKLLLFAFGGAVLYAYASGHGCVTVSLSDTTHSSVSKPLSKAPAVSTTATVPPSTTAVTKPSAKPIKKSAPPTEEDYDLSMPIVTKHPKGRQLPQVWPND